jgi:hypothetical protein
MKIRKLAWTWFSLMLLLVPFLSIRPDAALASAEQNVNVDSEEIVKFKIINKSEAPLRIKLQGPKTYYLDAPVGTSKYDVLPGTYTYSYTAYGRFTEDNLDILKNGAQLIILSQAVKARINNKTGVPVALRLEGPQTKTISVLPGKTKFDIWKGSYNYSFSAYGLFKSGTVELLSNSAELVLEKLTTNLKIDNKSGAQVRLSLSGPRSYNLALPTGKTKVEVLKGEYSYSYLDHGVSESGEIPIQGEQANLTLPNQIAALKIDNKSGSDVMVSLQGNIPYALSAASGVSKHEIRRGTYKYKYYTCGEWQSGEVLVNQKSVLLKILSCQSASNGTVKVVIVNDTFGMLTLHLSGPQDYRFYISPGKETVEVVKGTYDYTAYGCGGASKTGTRKITTKFNWRFWCQ